MTLESFLAKKQLLLNSPEKNVLALFFTVKILLLVFVLLFYETIPFSQRDYDVNSDHFHGQAQSRLEMGLSPYDGPQYLDIAYFGYPKIGKTDSKKFAFFPLYPALIKIFAPIFSHNFTLSGVIISFISHLFGAIFFFKLLIFDKKETKSAFSSLKYFLIYPTALFFFSVYTESLFFLLSVLTVYLLRQKKWWLAGMVGFLGALTRPPGILLFIPFIIEFFLYLREIKIKNFLRLKIREKISIFAPFLIPLGTFSYFVYLYLAIGNFNAYFDALSYWKKSAISLKNLFNVLFDKISHFNDLPLHSFYSSKLDLVFGLAFILLLLVFWKKIRFSYFAYGLALVILPLLSGQTMSLMRYLSVCFPVFMILGNLGAKNKVLDVFISTFSLLLLAIFSLKLFNWYWIG